MSGANRFPRHYRHGNTVKGGDNSAQSSLDLDRDGSAVYVQQQHKANANQRYKHKIKQPALYREKHLDDDDEVLVSKFEYEEFVWWSETLTGELPLLYKQVLEKLGVWKTQYGFELQGFTCFRHKKDKERRCDVKYIYLPQVWCGKYHPYASIKHKRRASMRTLERLEHLEKITKKSRNRFDYLVKLDLTLPKYVSLKWNDEDTQIKIRRAAQRFLELLHDELFPGKKSQFGVICNHHFWRTKRPLEPHRHIHLTIPNVCYNKSEDKFYRFKPYLDVKKDDNEEDNKDDNKGDNEDEKKDENDLNVLKKCWKTALTEHGLWAGKKDTLPDCRWGYIKFSDRNKVLNRLAYCCRKPVEDMIVYLKPEDLEFFDDTEEFANFLIDYTPRVVNLGFLTNLKRFGHHSNKPKALICPVCGGEMVVLQTENGLIECLDRPPPCAPKLLRDRKGVWYVLSGSCGSE